MGFFDQISDQASNLFGQGEQLAHNFVDPQVDFLTGKDNFANAIDRTSLASWGGEEGRGARNTALGIAGLVLTGGALGYGAAGAEGAAAAGSTAAAASSGFFTGATPWLVGAGVLGNLYTGAQSSAAMKYAADKSAAASEASLAFQQQAFNAQEPYREAGAVGLEGAKRLASDPNAYKESPYAHWLTQQGEASGRASAAASGGMSGGALAAMSQQAQGQAGAGFSDQYNRFANLAGLGQAATSTQGNIATNMGNILQHGADVQGNTAMAIAGQQGTTFNNILNTVSMGAGMNSGNWSNRPPTPAAADRTMYDFSQPSPSASNWNSAMPNQSPETNWYS